MRLFYTNIRESQIPAVKKAFEEFEKENPEAAKWLYNRLDVHEEAIAMGHYLLNGYNDTAVNYEKRFKSNVEQREKVTAEAQMEFNIETLKEAIKNQEKKPVV